MTPVRAPDVVRGDVLGLLCRAMPVVLHIRIGDNDGVTQVRGVLHHVEPADDGDGADTVGYYQDARIGRGRYYGASLTIDWSDRAAIHLCLAWLADRGHACTWMLPTTHGGRVEAWDGLTAWEVSVILVARSVGRVGRGLGVVKHLLSAYGPEELFGHDGPEPHQTRRAIGGVRRIGPMRVVSVGPAGWFCDRAILPRGANVQCDDWARGPETGDAGKLAADRAALADGCALLSPGGVALPDLGADHE